MEALVDLLFKMADDALIYGHRNSEWTGIGPTLEEDIAFSSIAQDKVGHAYNLYRILNEYFGMPEADTLAFQRPEELVWRNAKLNEIYSKDYAFVLMRHFLFDHAEAVRFQLLQDSSIQPVAEFAVKIKGEIKYHTMHADTWVKKLGNTSGESLSRMQQALDIVYPMAYAFFEPSSDEEFLIENGIFPGEDAVRVKWEENIKSILSMTQLQLPEVSNTEEYFGGRQGEHNADHQKLIDEMCEVFNLDPSAEW